MKSRRVTQSEVNFEEIYHWYAERILNLTFRMTRDEEVARDLTQDIFIKAFQNFNTFRNESQVYTWLYRIAINHVLNFLKKQKRWKYLDILDKKISDIFTEKALKNGEKTFNDHEPNPEAQLEAKEKANIIWQVVQKLPPKLRIPFVLHRYEEMSYQEIANLMDISLSAVESRIHRARKIIIRELTPFLDKI